MGVVNPDLIDEPLPPGALCDDPDGGHVSHFCYVHYRCERDQSGDFKACGECFHVWRSEEEFYHDVVKIHFEVGLGLYAHNIDLDREFCCPLCTHDF